MSTWTWLAARLERRAASGFSSRIQAANNETGVLQPVAEAARAGARAMAGSSHTDAVQAAGKIRLRHQRRSGRTSLTLSAHKLGGPKGVGAIVLASDEIELGDRLLRGGGQERGYRAGTENVAGIVGFGVAAELAGRDSRTGSRQSRLLCSRVRRRLAANRTRRRRVRRRALARLPNTLAFAIPGIRAETALIRFDLEGVAVSSGSACSSGKVRRSHVLEAMGVPPALADGAIRVSFGWNSTKEDVTRFAVGLRKARRDPI